tara:strand:+ start:25413 stop:28763 length:3351 start_codon:yes stop_codon:yes gene_type:complete
MDHINKFLNYYLNQKLKLETINFILSFLIFVCFSSILLILIEKSAYLDPLIKNKIFLNIIFITLSSILFIIIKIIIHKFNINGNSHNNELAKELSNKIKLKDSIINALQIFTSNQNNKYSDLIDKAVLDVEKKLNYDELKSLFPNNYNHKIWILFLIIFIFFFILNINPNLMNASTRLININSDYVKPLPFSLIIEPKNKSLYTGDKLDLKIIVNGEIPDELDLFWESNNQIYQKKISEVNDVFSFSFNSITTNTNFWAEYKSKYFIPFKNYQINSDTILIIPKKRPKLKKLDIIIEPPSYTNIKNFKHQNNLTIINALKGSIITIKGESDEILNSAILKFNNSIMNMDLNGKKILKSFQVDSLNEFNILLKDYNDNINSKLKYQVKPVYDMVPIINIDKPTKSLKIDESMSVNISAQLADDFGLDKVILEYYIIKPYSFQNDTIIYSSDIIKYDNQTNQHFKFKWDISKINIGPGDEIIFWLRVFDNNNFDGPGIAKSQNMSAYYPSLDELFMEVQNEQDNFFESFENMDVSMEKLKNKYEEISNEILKEQLGWDQQESSNEMIGELEKIENKINELENTIEKIEQINDKNNLVNESLGDKIESLRKMFEEIITPELMKALEELQKSMDENDLKDSLEQLNNFEFEMSDLENQLDRMMKLFEQIITEQKFEEIIKRIDEMKNIQNDMTNNIEQKKEFEIDAIENNQIQNFDELIKNIKEASELTKESNTNISNKLNELINSNLSKKLNNDFKEIKNNNFDDKKTSSKKIEGNLLTIESKLDEIIDEYNNNSKIEILVMYTRVIKNLIDLSYNQEELYNLSKAIKYKNNPMVKDLTVNQNLILEQYKTLFLQITDLSNKSFYIKPEISKSFGQIFKYLVNSISNLEQGQIKDAKISKINVLNHMNESVILLLTSMDEMQASSTPSGYEQYMEALSELGQAQQSMNKGMQSMLPLPMGQQGQNGLMQSLLNQQKELMAKLQQLMDENSSQPGGKEGQGELGKALDDMNDIINDLQNNILNEETYEKGTSVYNKLLNHQKANKEKGMDDLWKTDKYDNENLKKNNLDKLTKNKDIEIKKLYESLNILNQNQDISPENKNIVKEYIKILIDEKIESNED